MGKAWDNALPNWVGNKHEHHRCQHARLLKSDSCRSCNCKSYIGPFRHDTGCKFLEAIRVSLSTKQFNFGGPTILITALNVCASHAKRPRNRQSSNSFDEIASSHRLPQGLDHANCIDDYSRDLRLTK